jgi:hypothetical protein
VQLRVQASGYSSIEDRWDEAAGLSLDVVA